MLPRQNRLKDNIDFDKIFKNGRKISTPFFLFAYIPAELTKATRIGVVASKKVGGAVQRNRAKRILRVASKIILEKYPTGLDACFVANSSIITLTSQELQNIISKNILVNTLL